MLLRIMLALLCFTSLACVNKTEQEERIVAEIIKTMPKPKETILTHNVGQKPSSFDLFGDNEIAERVKNLTGDTFSEIVKNFNVESTVRMIDNIYMVSGCKIDACHKTRTVIYHNAINDKVKVLYFLDGKEKIFQE